MLAGRGPPLRLDRRFDIDSRSPRRMCGIVGYVGPREARPLLLAGLEKLEYRGYDSAGISVLDGGRHRRRPRGRQPQRAAQRDRRARSQAGGNGGVAVAAGRSPAPGIGHTRWATHGRVTEENAHPHFDTTDRVHVVVNGIVENYVALKRRLIDMGARVHLRDRRRGDRPPDRPPPRARRPGRRGPRRLRRAARPLRVRRDERRRAGRARRRPQGVPADHRPRRRRAVHRLGDPGVPARDHGASSTSTTTRSSC